MVFEILESKMNFTENDTLGTDQDVFEQFTQGLYAYGIPIIFVIGTFGNLLSFKVFMFTSFGNHSSSIYIAALSISDTLFLLSLLISWLGGGRIGVLYVHSPVWCQVMIYVTYVCSFLSVWYVVLIMIDRYIVVCHSLHVPEWCTKRRARIATATITIFGMVLYSHIFFTAEVTGENCTVEYKEFLHNILSIFIYTDTAITFIIPFAIIFFLNLVIIISIKRFQNRHEFLKDRKRTITDSTPENVLSKAQYRITRTFILVSVVLLVTNVPSHGIRFYIIVNSVYQQGTSVLMHAQHVFQIIYYFNFAVNFLLYSVSSSKFRKYISFRHLCGTCYRRLQRRSNAHMQYYR